MAITLRRATLADVPLLEHWDSQPHVITCSGSDDTCDWREELSLNVDWYECIIAELHGRPIGVIQIIDPAEEETHYWGNCGPDLRAIDIWIGKLEDLGKGYGTEMMEQAHERCFACETVKAILLDPLVNNEGAHRFYERLGYQRIDHRMFGEDDCFVYQLTRSDWAEGPSAQ